MDVDMLAHFDEWQRAGQDDAYEAQDQWPVELRRARLITAVDYMQVTRELAQLRHGDMSSGDYYAKVQDIWRELELYEPVSEGHEKAQRARGKLIREIHQCFVVDAFIGNATDWEKVCLGNLVGMPVVIVPTGFKNITNPPEGGSQRRTTITTGIYAPPRRDNIALALAMAYQSVTDHHRQRPPIDDLGPHDPVPIN
eukprot:TRINITY_DN3316_c0_g2_i13.p1 TRINITY_DN3316_c0_g2~~TRINITY_DN3316_c0_g2_i13.p1  ORF type:complete len:197 (+),score=38.06 TRINITY_DN3316_c0_g2_i13:1407-1997(+)